MEILFKAHDILKRGKGLTFNDVLLVPQHSEISSRRTPNLSTRITKRYNINLPIVTANMDTVSGPEMCIAMAALGGLGILHRFMTTQDQILDVQRIKAYQKEHGIEIPIAASIGVKEEGMQRADVLANEGVEILTLDIAHGDSIMMMEVLEYVKKRYPHIDVIAGNVATSGATQRLISAGADAVKVGIGPGSMCTTRIITGHGVPQLSAIAMCVNEANKHDIPVIADGGIKTSGDIVKALAAGASSIMVGSLVSGCLETPGEIKSGMKAYRGMASKDAQVSWRGELPKGMAAEGESTMIPCKGSVTNVIHELTGGLRSGMTYLGVDKISDMFLRAEFIEMTSSGFNESLPHGVK